MGTPGIAPAMGPSTPERPASADPHGRWRYELERAQAQLRAPAVPGANAPARAVQAVPGMPGLTSTLPSAQAAETAARGATGPAPAGTPVTPGSANTSLAPNGERTNRPVTAAGTSGRIERPNAQSEPAVRAAAPRPAPPAAAWPEVNAHVAVRGGLATVWIRDTRLTPETLAQLEREVRARLRVLGAKLEQLFVNGQRVEPIGAPDNSMQQLTGGKDGD